MATVLEIANATGVPAEQVLRVVNGEAVSGEVEERVLAAMELLGRPLYPPPARNGEPAPAPRELEAGADGALDRLGELAAELEAALPARVGGVVYEALRVEVRPVAAEVAGVAALLETLAGELRRLQREVRVERRDRVDDLELQVDLLRASWTSVDRRLGRIERVLTRLENADSPRAEQPRSALTPLPDNRPAGIIVVRDRNDPAADGSG